LKNKQSTEDPTFQRVMLMLFFGQVVFDIL
jgi:hypothetical protein